MPRGFPGPGGIGFAPFAHGDFGGYHHGLRHLTTTCQVPSGVGIHGTPDDTSIGYSASHGCIRMHIPDAEWLFNHVTIGAPVFIVPQ